MSTMTHPSSPPLDISAVRIRRILCPVDFSRFSENALRHAAALAKWYGAELQALHVTSIPSGVAAFPPFGASVPLEPPDPESVLEELRAFVRPIEDSFVSVKETLAEGGVVAAILEAAARLPADLIVMGTHGRSGFERLLLGSATERVLRQAPCPVLTVPAGDTQPAGALLFGTIVCPVDFSSTSRTALRTAASLAAVSLSHLTVLYALERLPEGAEHAFVPRPAARERELLEKRAREDLHAFVVQAGEIVPCPEEVVATGRAHRAILSAAKERDAGLVVMGVQGRSAFDLALLGSTTNQVVREASCPVLTLRKAESGPGGDAPTRPE